MSKFGMLFALAGALSLASQSAVARSDDDDARGMNAGARAFSTNAAVAYNYGRGGSSWSFHVKSFTHPSTGVYCIRPSVKLNFAAIYPQVSINLSDSNSNTMLAYWVASADACPAHNLEVETYDFGSGTNTLSDGVAFNFVIE
jgi:hypothetical protein